MQHDCKRMLQLSCYSDTGSEPNMTPASNAVPYAPTHFDDNIRVVETLQDVSMIFDEATNIVVYRGVYSQALKREAELALHEANFTKLLTVSPTPIGAKELASCFIGWPEMAAHVHSWVQVLAELTDSSQVGVRLARVDSSMCPRLHVDRVMLRVVSTLCGAATEFVRNADVLRNKLGHATAHSFDQVSEVLVPGAAVQHAEPGDIVLLKGEAWPENLGRGAVHRSPRASPSSPRLVMTLDPL